MTAGARWAAPALVALLTLVAFLPGLRGQFVNWDDGLSFLENPHYRGLGWANLRWMFTTFHMGLYMPLAWITLGWDYLLWGMNPVGYHASSLLLHAATAVAFYFLSLRLLRLAVPEAPGGPALAVAAAASALLFALHPLRVESVSWVTERRDPLSGLFYVTALIAYLNAVGAGARLTRRWYWGAVALFAAALLSKPITVTLPVVLLALDAYPLRRWGAGRGWPAPRLWVEKLPFFALAGAAVVVGFIANSQVGNLRSWEEMGLLLRVLLSIYGLAFYLFRTLVPLSLSPLYPLAVQISWLHFAAVLGGAALALALRRRWPAFTVAAAVYAVTLAPVLGIFQNGPQAVADRYSYLACLGWALLAGSAALPRWPGAPAVRAALGAAILALGALTWQQSGIWLDSVTLWRHAASVTPDMRAAHFNLARAYEAEGRVDEAVAAYRETLRLSVNKAPWHVKIGTLHEGAGRLEAALGEFLEARRADPASREACEGIRRVGARLGGAPPAAGPCSADGVRS